MSQQEKGNVRVICPQDGAFCALSFCRPGLCHEQRGITTAPPEHDHLRTAADAIRARIKTLKQTHATELEYVAHRLRERDWHGLWDGAIGAAEWEIERDALLWCLEQLGVEP